MAVLLVGNGDLTFPDWRKKKRIAKTFGASFCCCVFVVTNNISFTTMIEVHFFYFYTGHFSIPKLFLRLSPV